MARKTSKKKEENKSNKLLWFILCILLAVLIIITVSKIGIFGMVSSNVLTYLFGSLYVIVIVSIFCYGVYALFIKDNHEIPGKSLAGVIVLVSTILLLNAYINEDVITFGSYVSYLSDNFLKAFRNEPLALSGGVLPNFFNVLLQSLLASQGTLIIIVALFIISAILIVPFSTYRMVFDTTRETVSNKHEELKKHREEERIAAQKAEEIRKARQAEEMARLAEEEEKRKEKEKQALLERMALKEEQKRIAEEKRKKEEERKKREAILSKSTTFINLNEEEIYGKKKKNSENIIGEEPKSETNELDELVRNAPKVHKVKRSNSAYRLPKPYEEFLEAAKSTSSSVNKTSAAVKGEKVIEILSNFGIQATLLNTYIGPSVTKFEIKPDSSVKINKIMNISDNIKMELAAKDIRIEAPIPGRSAVGIEIPNVEPIPVRMLDLIKGVPAEKRKLPLLFCLGKDLMGKPVYCDLSKMPHLLIAGATGSGKSVCINSIITSFLLRTNPDDVKLVLVDPKKVEFTPYKDIPHLLWPIIDDPVMASNMLKKVVVIMEERYDAFATVGVRNIDGFNSYVSEYNENLKSGEDQMNRMPYMVVIIDELADLMAIAGKDVELSIQRITQLARASGIHLIVATQRPSTDVITGLIKSNIPSRISFAVASSIDSRTILDQTGAERLLGNGDMLYYPQGETAPIRMQGVFVTDKEINKITSYVKSQAKPDYEDSYYEFLTNMNGTTVMSASSVNADSQDSLYDDVVEFVRAQQKASTSLLQRRFGIGYNRAARLIDTLEDRGIIGPANGSKPREVYLKEEDEIEE